MKRDANDYPFDEREFVASATECTGLVAALPLDDEEADADLARLYAVLEPLEKQKEVRKECQTEMKEKCEKP